MRQIIEENALSQAIHSDHRRLRLLLSSSGRQSLVARRRAEFSTFQLLLGAHNLAVEETLYTSLHTHPVVAGRLARAAAQNQFIEACAQLIDQQLNHDVALSRAMMGVLGELMDSHAVVEEQELVSVAVQLGPQNHLNVLAAAYRQRSRAYERHLLA